MNKLYPTHERFKAFQGEGIHMGRPAFFIRTYGCPVKCPFCDSAGTWHPQFVPKDIERLSVEQLVQEAAETLCEFVVITGGEPTVHDLTALVTGLAERGIPSHLETSGAFEFDGMMFDWVTLSPKRWKMPLEQNYEQANEFKLIIEKPEDIRFYTHPIEEHCHSLGTTPIWLHPEWSQRENSEVLGAICEAVEKGGGLYRAGWQLHKCYRVDQRDNRTRANVPLGGNPEKGY